MSAAASAAGRLKHIRFDQRKQSEGRPGEIACRYCGDWLRSDLLVFHIFMMHQKELQEAVKAADLVEPSPIGEQR